MKIKILLWSVVSILIIGLVAATVWWELRPQTITLSNGAKLTLVAVQYGKKHAPPKIKTPAGTHTRRGNSINTTNDTLVVWIEQQHAGNNWPNYQLFAYDLAGTACAQGESMAQRQIRPGDDLVGIQFNTFPRRDRKFLLRVMEWNPRNGQQFTTNAFVISNPARGPFPEWHPASLPDTQSDGDLDVTLKKLVFGVKPPYQRNGMMPDDPMNKGVQVAFEVQQDDHAATNWQPVQVVTSDATGNRVTGWINRFGPDADDGLIYQYGLWSDEPAWKVRVEFSRTSGFHGDELWTVSEVPLSPGRMQDFWNYGRNRNQTNAVFAETTLQGVHLKLFQARHFTDQSPSQGGIADGILIRADKLPDGMQMTLVKATDDQGRELQGFKWSWGGNEFRFGLRGTERPGALVQLAETFGILPPPSSEAKTLNLTIALHKSRFVEFTAKPEKAAADNP